MKILKILDVAIRSLKRAPVRSGLTALGIIVGVAAVIATTSIGNGARLTIQSSLLKPETRTIFLAALPSRSSMRRPGAKLAPGDGLKPADYYAIRNTVPNLAAISPRIYLTNARARANGRSADIVLEGLDVGGFITVPRRLHAGALFSDTDVRRAANVCVVSESLAARLFPGEDRANRLIQLNNVAFRVIGIVDDAVNFTPAQFDSSDLHVYVPFTSLLRRLDTEAQISVSAQVRDMDQMTRVQRDIHDVMEQRRSARKADFRTNNALESIKAYTDGSLAVARLLAAVGAISLVVGGIGIMNIMLASASERTREIGVRMAIGTRQRDILCQFLAEAMALSLLGGCLGVALGWAVAGAITYLNEWPTAVTLPSILTALFCSLIVGLFFGYHPARRAALLRPVDALRTEN